MASASVYVGTPKHPRALLGTANTNRDGTGTCVKVVTAGGSGGRYELATVKATAATTAGMIRLYTSQDTGTTKSLLDELDVTAVATPGATVKTFRGIIRFPNGLVLDAAEEVYASTEKGEAFWVTLETGGNF